MASRKSLLFTVCAGMIWSSSLEASTSQEDLSPENAGAPLSSSTIEGTPLETAPSQSRETINLSIPSPLVAAKCVNCQSLLLSAALNNFSRIAKTFAFDLGHLPSGILLRPDVEDHIGGDQLIERLATYDYKALSKSILRGDILPLLPCLKSDFLALARWLFGDYEKLILSYREKLNPRKNVQLHGFQLSISLLQKVQNFAETYNSELVSFVAALENDGTLDPTVLLGLQTAPLVLQELTTDYQERVHLLIRSPRGEDIGGARLDGVVRSIRVKKNTKKLKKQPRPSEEEIAKAVGENHISPRYAKKKRKAGVKVSSTHPSDKGKEPEKTSIDAHEPKHAAIKRVTETNHLSPRPELQRTSSASKLLRRIKGTSSHASDKQKDKKPGTPKKTLSLKFFERATEGSPRKTPPSSPSSTSGTPKISSPLASPQRSSALDEGSSAAIRHVAVSHSSLTASEADPSPKKSSEGSPDLTPPHESQASLLPMVEPLSAGLPHSQSDDERF